ncbi:hypothetical protein T06_15755 [Trichinella sp. T6]|nr:hypothetical protein T06_15755 [Trichinella sp. T6]
MQLITSVLLSSIYPQLVVVDSYCVSIHALLFDLPNLSTKLDTINVGSYFCHLGEVEVVNEQVDKALAGKIEIVLEIVTCRKCFDALFESKQRIYLHALRRRRYRFSANGHDIFCIGNFSFLTIINQLMKEWENGIFVFQYLIASFVSD